MGLFGGMALLRLFSKALGLGGYSVLCLVCARVYVHHEGYGIICMADKER